MQIVIDIPEKDYDQMDAGELIDTILVAVKNGTPLPESHGDLIDRQSLINNGIEKGFCDWYDEIKYAPTIIEADKESETDKHSCSKCRYLGWENVGEGVNPVCEQEPYTDVDKETGRPVGLYKSEPTIEDRNNCCYWRAKEVRDK